MRTNEQLYPDYVSTDYDKWIFDHVIDRTLVDEWRSLVNARRVLIASAAESPYNVFGRSMRMWPKLHQYWCTLKQAYIAAGGLYTKPWYV